MAEQDGGQGQAEAQGRGAAERARRKAANQAERLARRAANQARRAAAATPRATEPQGAAVAPEAPPAASAEPAPAAAAADQVPRPQSIPFNILIVAQQGRIGREALLFAASLRHSAPGWQGRLIVAEPLPEAAWEGAPVALDPELRAALQAHGAEISPFVARHFGRAYPHGNKIEALALLPPGEPFMFFDSDTLVTGPLDGLQVDFSRPTASMRRSPTWPEPPLYGPGLGAIWKSLYDRFGLAFQDSLDPAHAEEHWERYLYFNAGWFLGPDPQVFGRLFLDWALALREDPGEALACQSLDPWLDQAVLPLVIHALGGGRPGPELAGLDGALTCHYRTLSLLYAREPRPASLLLETLMRDPELARHFDEDAAMRALVMAGDGAARVRALVPDPDAISEKVMRQRLKAAGLWFR